MHAMDPKDSNAQPIWYGRPGRRGPRLLPIDVVGGLFVAFGLAVATILPEATVGGLVLIGCGVGVCVVARRRRRQREEELDADRQRGFAGRQLMPLGDRVATVIARTVLTLVITGILAGIGMGISRTTGAFGPNADLVTAGAWLFVLATTAAVGWWTWRDLQAKNRKLAEPLCPQCGYVLYGVKDFRCPDCGRPFAMAELNVNLVRLDEEGRLQPKD